MFIPRGKTLHDNLATSYVMVDALVEDLCEGGFSGVVEVVLRNTDGYVMIDHGAVVATIERHEISGERQGFTATTIAQLATRARGERGRISVYGVPPGAAAALAAMVDAEPLYTALSTDFADLEKMIAKLRRENDRQWFVEVTTQSGSVALVHIADDRCRVMRSDGAAPQFDGSEVDGEELKQLLEECARVGGAFDVYFKRAGGGATFPPVSDELPAEQVGVTPFVIDHEKHETEVTPAAAPRNDVAGAGLSGIGAADEALEADSVSPVAAVEPQEPPFVIERNHNQELESQDDIRQDKDRYWSGTPAAPILSAAVSASTSGVDSVVLPVSVEPDEVVLDAPADAPAKEQKPPLNTRALLAGDPVEVAEAETMSEIKRLMSEIARTIDEASRAVEQRDAFSMYLRAGQLRIADRYPFLDPFGAEFEYLSGEIAFIGKASPSQFKEGLTESLRLAVTGLAQSSAQPARLRAHVTEDLDKLLERLRPDLERFGLDYAIEQIITL